MRLLVASRAGHHGGLEVSMGQEGARGRGRPRVERAPRGRASPSHTRASYLRARARAPTCVRACVCAQRPLCGGLAAGQLWTGCFAHALLRGVGGAVEPPAGAQQGCLQPCSGCWTAHLCAGLRHGRARQACVTAGQGREDVLTPLPSDPRPPWHPPPAHRMHHLTVRCASAARAWRSCARVRAGWRARRARRSRRAACWSSAPRAPRRGCLRLRGSTAWQRRSLSPTQASPTAIRSSFCRPPRGTSSARCALRDAAKRRAAGPARRL